MPLLPPYMMAGVRRKEEKINEINAIICSITGKAMKNNPLSIISHLMGKRRRLDGIKFDSHSRK